MNPNSFGIHEVYDIKSYMLEFNFQPQAHRL